jgi:hypothetical protein
LFEEETAEEFEDFYDYSPMFADKTEEGAEEGEESTAVIARCVFFSAPSRTRRKLARN